MSTRQARILVIDNYDSFTYNLVQYVRELGAHTTVWRNDAFELDQVAEFAADGIIVSPGPCTPREAGHSVAVIERFGATTPIFGVCLGHQSIGAAYGAKVVRAKQLVHGQTALIEHDGTGVFAQLPAPFSGTRYHSLVVEDLPPELVANAWTTEAATGQRIVMGMRHAQHPVWGVQFHPESVLTEHGHALLGNFLTLAGHRAD